MTDLTVLTEVTGRDISILTELFEMANPAT